MGIFGTAKINRKDFGLMWNAAFEAGGILVGDEETITLDVQFAKSEHQVGGRLRAPQQYRLGAGPPS
jgi:polyisoprenoid-binding protein YceI